MYTRSRCRERRKQQVCLPHFSIQNEDGVSDLLTLILETGLSSLLYSKRWRHVMFIRLIFLAFTFRPHHLRFVLSPGPTFAAAALLRQVGVDPTLRRARPRRTHLPQPDLKVASDGPKVGDRIEVNIYQVKAVLSTTYLVYVLGRCVLKQWHSPARWQSA